jgi:hypothetical protein
MRSGDAVCQAKAAGAAMVLLARIIDATGRLVRPADIRQVDCIVRQPGSCARDVHGFAVKQRDVFLPALVRDSSWTLDEVGYNFRHDVTRVAEFFGARGGGRVEVRYLFSLANGGREMVSFYLKLG